MRFEVPQFIEIEDKIIGPLTWRQFLYIGGGVGFLIIFYLTLPFTLFVLFGLPVGVLSVSLAFHKINNRPFSIFLESLMNYMTKKRLYLWKREREQSIIEKSDVRKAPTPKLNFAQKKSLSALARKLDMHLSE